MTIEKPVTLADVAARAGVDSSVVSRVLSGDRLLRAAPATKQRVFDASRELGYRPNFAARALRSARSRAYGLIIPDFENPVHAAIIRGAQQEATNRDCLLLIAGSVEGKTLQDHVTMLGHGRVDGVLVIAGADPRRGSAYGGESTSLPWIQLNARTSRRNRYVIFDDARAAELAVDHLAQLGHTRIAHVSGPSSVYSASRGSIGFRRALARAGVTSEPVEVEAGFTAAAGASAMAALMKMRPRPTAAFVSNLAVAMGMQYAALDMGLRIPDDLSLVAVHDIELASFFYPRLTTVRMPLEEMGRRGIELLATLDGDEPVADVIKHPMEIVERGSTGAVPRRSSAAR